MCIGTKFNISMRHGALHKFLFNRFMKLNTGERVHTTKNNKKAYVLVLKLLGGSEVLSYRFYDQNFRVF